MFTCSEGEVTRRLLGEEPELLTPPSLRQIPVVSLQPGYKLPTLILEAVQRQDFSHTPQNSHNALL